MSSAILPFTEGPGKLLRAGKHHRGKASGYSARIIKYGFYEAISIGWIGISIKSGPMLLILIASLSKAWKESEQDRLTVHLMNPVSLFRVSTLKNVFSQGYPIISKNAPCAVHEQERGCVFFAVLRSEDT